MLTISAVCNERALQAIAVRDGAVGDIGEGNIPVGLQIGCEATGSGPQRGITLGRYDDRRQSIVLGWMARRPALRRAFQYDVRIGATEAEGIHTDDQFAVCS